MFEIQDGMVGGFSVITSSGEDSDLRSAIREANDRVEKYLNGLEAGWAIVGTSSSTCTLPQEGYVTIYAHTLTVILKRTKKQGE